MMMSLERFERWIRGLDPQIHNPFLVARRVEELDERLAATRAAAAVIAADAVTAATLVLQTAIAAAAALAQNAVNGFPPLLAIWRTVLQASGSHVSGIGANTFTLGSGTQVVIAGNDSPLPSQTISIQAADFPTVGSATPKFRLRVQLFTNSTDTNAKFFFRLYPIDSVNGGPNNNSFTLGAFVPDSEAGISGPGVASINDLVSSEFELPADGVYVIGLETGQTLTADSHVVFSAQLQVHNT